eukprot:COSAG05_NODE_5961_length_1051_cov_0.640756_1_plen_95_part_10
MEALFSGLAQVQMSEEQLRRIRMTRKFTELRAISMMQPGLTSPVAPDAAISTSQAENTQEKQRLSPVPPGQPTSPRAEVETTLETELSVLDAKLQ